MREGIEEETGVMITLGIDIGGSGIKGALVDTETGVLLGERHRIPTPQPATPDHVAATVRAIQMHFNYCGPVGIGLPAVVQKGITRTAANIHPEWVNFNAQSFFESVTESTVCSLNDADAAGLAEMRHGAGRGIDGVVMMLTLGTGC